MDKIKDLIYAINYIKERVSITDKMYLNKDADEYRVLRAWRIMFESKKKECIESYLKWFLDCL